MGNDGTGQLPPPDLRESGPRMRRLVLALVIGAVCGAAAYLIATALVKPEPEQPMLAMPRQMSAGTFVIWVGLVTGVVTFTIALVTQNALAKRKWRAERDVPRARVR